MSGPVVSRLMLSIAALDPDVSVTFSRHTQQWYVSASIEVGDGSAIITGLVEHRETPEAAIEAFFKRLIELSADEYVVSRYMGHRREWRWNGAVFAECTRPEVFEREAARAAEPVAS